MPKLLLAINTGNRAVPQGRSGTPAIISKNAPAQRGTSPSGGCHSLQSASGTGSPPSPPSTGCRLNARSPRRRASVVARASPSGVMQPLAVSDTTDAVVRGVFTAAANSGPSEDTPPAGGWARMVALIGSGNQLIKPPDDRSICKTSKARSPCKGPRRDQLTA